MIKRTTLIAPLVLGILGLDQIIKIIAKTNMPGKMPKAYLGNTVVFEYAENPGAFLSLGAKFSDEVRFWIFIVFVMAFVVWALWYVFKKPISKWEMIWWSTIIGGSIGNLIDRVLYGKVIDYIHMGIGNLRTGIFNLADFAIVLGMSALFIMSFEQKKTNNSKNEIKSEA